LGEEENKIKIFTFNPTQFKNTSPSNMCDITFKPTQFKNTSPSNMCDIEYCGGNPQCPQWVKGKCPQCQNVTCLDCIFGLLKWLKLPRENDMEGAAIGWNCPFCRKMLEVVGGWDFTGLHKIGTLMTYTNNSTLRLQSANSRPIAIEITINVKSREMSIQLVDD